MWTSGTYLALITVCRRQQEGDRALSIYEVGSHVTSFLQLIHRLVDDLHDGCFHLH